jgi:hypothetical protein
MARCRTIRPGFMTNEHLPELGMAAHLLYPMLWMIADREGRLEDRPRRIKNECMPAYDVDIEELLSQLASGDDPFIQRYEVDGKWYIQIIKWKVQQSPHHTEKASVIPEPPLDNREVTVKSQPSSFIDATSNQESVTSKSVIHDQQPVTHNSKSRNGSSGSRPTQLAKPGSTPNKPLEPFERWWSTVPKKVGKQAAQRAYDKAVKFLRSRPPEAGPGADDPHGFLLERMAAFAASPKARSDFCPNPSTWLSEGRYDDDPATWERSRQDPRGTLSALDQYLGDSPDG